MRALQAGDLVFDGLLLAADGSSVFSDRQRGPVGQAAAIGAAAGRAIRQQAGEDFLTRLGIGHASSAHTA